MLEFLDRLSNNSFLTTMFGAIVGGVIGTFTSVLIYKLQKRDDRHREKVRRYELRGEFAIEHGFRAKQDTVLAKMEVFISTYRLGRSGNDVDFIVDKDAKDKRGHNHTTFYIRNVGQSTINQLDLCVSTPKHIMILPYRSLSCYIDEHLTSFSVLCDERIPPRGLLRIDLYYRNDDMILNALSSTLLLVYMDLLHEVYEQPFFPEDKKIYEPRILSWEEYNHITRSQSVERYIAEGVLRQTSCEKQKRR